MTKAANRKRGRYFEVRFRIAFLFFLSLAFGASATGQTTAPAAPVLVIDSAAPAHPFPHFWEHIFGSGRAILSLRESYRDDLQSVKEITDLRYVRFHAIFHDEVGVYQENAQGDSSYNFSYVDQIYDGLQKMGVRPFVELSFMPNQLAAQDIRQAFWYKPNVSPPKDWSRWEELIRYFVGHLVDRYGVEEVGQWYFEVWNEPNIDFWGGEPKQATYWELYDHTARAVKQVSRRLRVGGPATAQAGWVDAFLEHCAGNHVPVDFVSTHVYGNDTAANVFGTSEEIPRETMVCRAVKKVHQQIQSSVLPNLPLIFSEYNASYMTEPGITDSVYMGPWLANTIRQCDGLVNEMSYWTFSDVFEEQGVVKQPFYGGYGLIAAGGIPKPAYRAFRLLHQLGDQRLELDSDSALLTRASDGRLVLALWNLVPAGQPGRETVVTIRVNPRDKVRSAAISRVDRDHGDPHPAYERMGSPRYPTETQLRELRAIAGSPVPEVRELQNGELIVRLPPDGLAVIELH